MVTNIGVIDLGIYDIILFILLFSSSLRVSSVTLGYRSFLTFTSRTILGPKGPGGARREWGVRWGRGTEPGEVW